MRALTDNDIEKAWRGFCTQQKKFNRQNFVPENTHFDVNKNRIEFKLTFSEWLDVWLQSGHFDLRGKKKGQYCMSRKNDIGHYEVGNVFIQLASENIRQARLTGLRSPRGPNGRHWTWTQAQKDARYGKRSR